ncbi:MAG: ABC transporter ATP-binding protein [Actinomycetota bacterium]|nr:ABC transporter ATP-binding protein [Actinomycetota bacterium]
MTDTPLLSAEALTRVYRGPADDVIACRSVNLQVSTGDFILLRGRSGAGKTTLLNLLGGLDRPSSGRFLIEGRVVASLSQTELTTLRRRNLGYVFQSFGLLPMLSAAENVEVPLRVQQMQGAERSSRVSAALAAVGLTGQARQRPGELSGGQQQRVGLARALAGRPRILLADEPTAQLDSVTAAGIINLIADLVAEHNMAAIVSTHHASMTEHSTRQWEIHDGTLTELPSNQPSTATTGNAAGPPEA